MNDILRDHDLALYSNGAKVEISDVEAAVIDAETGEVAIIFKTRLHAIQNPGAQVDEMRVYGGFHAGETVNIVQAADLPQSGVFQIVRFVREARGVMAYGVPLSRMVDWRDGKDMKASKGEIAVPADWLRKQRSENVITR